MEHIRDEIVKVQNAYVPVKCQVNFQYVHLCITSYLKGRMKFIKTKLMTVVKLSFEKARKRWKV